MGVSDLAIRTMRALRFALSDNGNQENQVEEALHCLLGSIFASQTSLKSEETLSILAGAFFIR